IRDATVTGVQTCALPIFRAGAYDFVTKPVSTDALALILERAIQHRTLTDELQRLRRRVHEDTLPQIVGSSDAIRRMSELVSRVEIGRASCRERGSGPGAG